MGEIGFELTVELAHLVHGTNKIARIKTAAAPSDGMQVESFRLDRGAMTVNAGGDMHLEPGIACCARHRQAVGDEVPVLGHEINHARRGAALVVCRRTGGHGRGKRARELRDRADDVIETGGPRRLGDERVVRPQSIEPDALRRRGEKTP